MGISFYTFVVSLIYLVGDGNEHPAPWQKAVFISVFPHPTGRAHMPPKDLLPQLRQEQARTIIEPERVGLLLLSALIKNSGWPVGWLTSMLIRYFLTPAPITPSI